MCHTHFFLACPLIPAHCPVNHTSNLIHRQLIVHAEQRVHKKECDGDDDATRGMGHSQPDRSQIINNILEKYSTDEYIHAQGMSLSGCSKILGKLVWIDGKFG